MKRLGLVIIIIIAFISIFFIFYNRDDAFLPDEDLISKQEKVDNKIKEITKDKSYTIDNPYILNNPYFISPLTSLIIFNSEYKIDVKVLINDELYKEISDYNFLIPIVYLVEGSNNKIDLICNNETYTYYIETPNISNNLISVSKTNDFNIIASSTKLKHFMMNGKGNLIWYLDLDTQGFIEPNSRDTFLIGTEESIKFGNTSFFSGIYEIDYLGKVLKRFDTPYGYHHEIKVIDDNRVLVLGTNTYPMDTLYELDTNTGGIMQKLSIHELLSNGNEELSSYLSSLEYGIEANSIDYLNGNVLLSLRNLNTVIEFSYDEKTINYCITNNDMISDKASCNKVFEFALMGEHNAKYINDNTISIYNNGYDHLTNKSNVASGLVLRIKNDVKVIEEYKEEKKYSYAFGSTSKNDEVIVNYPYMYKKKTCDAYCYDENYTNLVIYKDKNVKSSFKINDNLYRAIKFDISMNDLYRVNEYLYYGFNLEKDKSKINNAYDFDINANITNNSIEILMDTDRHDIEVYFKGKESYKLKYLNTRTYFKLAPGNYQIYIKIDDKYYKYKNVLKFN